jgi:hypothetical protein
MFGSHRLNGGYKVNKSRQSSWIIKKGILLRMISSSDRDGTQLFKV